jgi:hypothetical protein
LEFSKYEFDICGGSDDVDDINFINSEIGEAERILIEKNSNYISKETIESGVPKSLRE